MASETRKSRREVLAKLGILSASSFVSYMYGQTLDEDLDDGEYPITIEDIESEIEVNVKNRDNKPIPNAKVSYSAGLFSRNSEETELRDTNNLKNSLNHERQQIEQKANEDTPNYQKTDKNGYTCIKGLDDGFYVVHVEKEGYKESGLVSGFLFDDDSDQINILLEEEN